MLLRTISGPIAVATDFAQLSACLLSTVSKGTFIHQLSTFRFRFWRRMLDLNQRPIDYKSIALSTELILPSSRFQDGVCSSAFSLFATEGRNRSIKARTF